ncbi:MULTISPECIES: nucleobase:cation symporter-2 family protein [Clostridium]|uniref:Nucleobase:cation symporter-2 family protein n=1 Tax=Clostridium aquiflavi TaxID=3073603 RepID=A0ABU1ECS0_9CLOT|nr:MULTISPECIES: nucleobase:cation symporter-2 family protein [unclassified Clostridium]MDR5586181.1 nucleobase:cation symporter-2 family protein [Clostridium sp. 5N-1]NFG61186.1 purine permease [Clostridium botulinum]NFQ08932.1 purine permease [Clostridium botulinum]
MREKDGANLIPAVDKKIPFSKAWIFSLQHVMSMCAGAVAVPLMIGEAAGLNDLEIVFLINAGLFMAGIGTLIQGCGLKNIAGAKIPVIEGTSFAAVSGILAIIAGAHGDKHLAMTTVFGSVIIAGLFCFIISPVFGKLIKFFPKVVTGTVVLVIGISIMPVGIKWITGGIAKPATTQEVGLALAVLVITLLLFKYIKGIWNSAAILFSIVIGTLLAMVFGMDDFSKVKDAAWFSLNVPLKFGMPTFNISAIISMILIMLVLMTESVGNMIAIHEITDKEVTEENIRKGLAGDGISTFLAGIFNTFPITPFAQNTGLVGLTNIKSRFIGIYAGIILLILSFTPKFAATMGAIPKPVLGGVGFAMFGMVLVGGIKTLSKVNFDGNKNSVIVAVSIGLSMIPLANLTFYDNFPTWVQTIFHSGITTGSISAILLNIFFNVIGNENKEETVVNKIKDVYIGNEPVEIHQ